MIEMTVHGSERVLERANLAGDKALNLVERAYNKGKEYSECSPVLQKYVKNIYENHASNCVIKIFSNKVFIFGNKMLITMYDLPKAIVKNNHKKIKYYCA